MPFDSLPSHNLQFPEIKPFVAPPPPVFETGPLLSLISKQIESSSPAARQARQDEHNLRLAQIKADAARADAFSARAGNAGGLTPYQRWQQSKWLATHALPKTDTHLALPRPVGMTSASPLDDPAAQSTLSSAGDSLVDPSSPLSLQNRPTVGDAPAPNGSGGPFDPATASRKSLFNLQRPSAFDSLP